MATRCYVGHYMGYRCVGKYPGGELLDSDAGKDADEQLAGQSPDSILVKDGDGVCILSFMADFLK